MLKQRETRQDRYLPAIRVVHQSVVHVLGTRVACGGFQKHGLVEAAPNVLRRVDEVLDPACDPVDTGSCRIRVGNELGGLGREGTNGIVDGGQVGGDGVGVLLHKHDGVGGVDEVAVSGADQLAELLLLELDLGPSRPLHISDLWYGFGAEERLGLGFG